MTKILFIVGKFFIGTVSFQGGFFGGIIGLGMWIWACMDLIDLLGIQI